VRWWMGFHKSSPSIAFVTGHIGTENTRIPKKPRNFDAYFITNNTLLSQKAKKHYWPPILLKNIPLICGNHSTDNYLKNSFSSKQLKVFPDTFLEKHYDYVVWFDDKYNSKKHQNIDINNTIKHILLIHQQPSPPAILMHKHPFLYNINQEYECAIHYQPRYLKEQKQYQAYINRQLANGLSSNQGIHYQTGFIIYNFTHKKTKEIQSTWMQHIKDCGIQCQISFNFVHQLYPKCISAVPFRVTKLKFFNFIDKLTGN
jgi:hypothetical protein